MSDRILEVENLRKTFGGIVAVDDASFGVEEGTITGLIGPNGAGKTTTFNLVSGFYEPDGGTIRYRDQDIQDLMHPSRNEQAIWTTAGGVTFGVIGLGVAANGWLGAMTPPTVAGTAVGAGVGAGIYYGQEYARHDVPRHLERLASTLEDAELPSVGGPLTNRTAGATRHIADTLETKRNRPFQLAREGLVRTFQITRELAEMSVLENVMLAPMSQRGEYLLPTWFRRGRVVDQEREVRERAREIVEMLELDHLADEQAGNLSGGQRKLLELGRVLMTDPDVIMLDEPVAGVNPTLTRKLLERIRELRDEGYTFLIVEHDMEVIMNLSETIIVMSEGKKLMQGTPEEVRNDERVVEAYLGE